MRPYCLIAVTLAGGVLAPFAAAEPEPARVAAPHLDGDPARGGMRVLPTARWRWQLVMAPRLAPQIGALAVSGLAVVAGRAPDVIAVLGADSPPDRWPDDVDVPGVRSIPRPAPGERIAAAFGVTTFTLTAQDQGLEMLELRLRYEDGVAVWLNGLEVVRTALPERGATRLAKRPHGPEWETFYIPVGPGVLRLGPNVLAIEVHPSGSKHAPAIAVELVGRRDRGIVRGPVLAEIGATTARIAVETDPNTDAVLVWSAGAEAERRLTSPAGRHHLFTLTDLLARSRVRYRVHAGATQSAAYTFQPAPAAGDVVRIGIYGDVRGGHTIHRRVIEAMLAEPLDLVGITGDMVLDGADDGDWQRFFTITQPLLGQVPCLPAVGNHDLGWSGAEAARGGASVFALPAGPPGRPAGTYWYSHDLADIHVVVLDSNAYERVEQEAWLEADLTAARLRKVRAIIALTHDGPYSRGVHRGNTLARTRYVPILARHHVDLVLAGHDHLYQRGEIDGIRYVVSGGGGAPLYPISCGAKGKPPCAVEDGMRAIAREHHYLVLTITQTSLEQCARRADGRLLEPCTRSGLWRP